MSVRGRALGGRVTWVLCPKNLSQNYCCSSQVTVTHGSLSDEAKKRINSCVECLNNGEHTLTSKSLIN